MTKTAEQLVEENVMEPKEILASKLIDAWCASHGKQIPWAKAVEISAIVTDMSEHDKARLLALD